MAANERMLVVFRLELIILNPCKDLEQQGLAVCNAIEDEGWSSLGGMDYARRPTSI